jgi:two-component system response regulator
MKEQDHIILLVEDNDDDAELTRRAFARNTFSCTLVVVRNGQEALDYLFAAGDYAHRNPTELPWLVLLDLNLPKVGGLEVLKRIRESSTTKRLPVVILTTSREEKDIISSYDLGANSYVRKPVDFAQFVKTTQQLSAYWLVLNEQAPDASNRPLCL